MKTTIYKPVPVDAAKHVADTHDKDIVIIVSVDDAHNQTHFTTYGRAAEDKPRAARIGEMIAEATGHGGTARYNEDFRTLPIATAVRHIETLRGAIRAAQAARGLSPQAESILARAMKATDDYRKIDRKVSP